MTLNTSKRNRMTQLSFKGLTLTKQRNNLFRPHLVSTKCLYSLGPHTEHGDIASVSLRSIQLLISLVHLYPQLSLQQADRSLSWRCYSSQTPVSSIASHKNNPIDFLKIISLPNCGQFLFKNIQFVR